MLIYYWKIVYWFIHFYFLSGEHKLAQDFRDLFLDCKGSDVILKVKGNDFSCHQTILIARSKVFAPMFEHDMKEKDSREVIIEDCDPTAFKLFLEYLYTGSIETLSEDSIFNLYHISDKYDVSGLKEVCVDFIQRSLTIESFCDFAKFALLYNVSTLLEEFTIFFAENIRKICKLVQWKSFLEEHPAEGNEFYMKALRYHGICD